jgi:cell wall-associated NlpC family hydrolase
VPASTPSLAFRAAVVATGTTAAALLTLLPAAPPAPAPTAVVAAPGESAPAPFQAARHALGTTTSGGLSVAAPQAVTPAPAAGAPAVQAPAAGAPAVQAPVALVAAAKPAAPAVAAAAGRRSSAMSIAMGKLGSPYRWGAAGPGAFDCSGLVYWSYRQLGTTLPRSSSAQSRVGTPVSKGALQPGDLVFFYRPVSHVAIYIGGGRVVHASTSGQPVKISKLGDMPFATARRI